MARFETKVRHARFVVGPFSPEAMETIGTDLTNSISARIHRGLNANDAPAKALKTDRRGRRGYPDRKTAMGLQSIRDWFWRGKTMRALKVKSVNENQGVIGFVDPQADAIAHINNKIERAFGVSPADREVLVASVQAAAKQAKIIQVKAS